MKNAGKRKKATQFINTIHFIWKTEHLLIPVLVVMHHSFSNLAITRYLVFSVTLLMVEVEAVVCGLRDSALIKSRWQGFRVFTPLKLGREQGRNLLFFIFCFILFNLYAFLFISFCIPGFILFFFLLGSRLKTVLSPTYRCMRSTTWEHHGTTLPWGMNFSTYGLWTTDIPPKFQQATAQWTTRFFTPWFRPFQAVNFELQIPPLSNTY